jgi:hypothetical protein
MAKAKRKSPVKNRRPGRNTRGELSSSSAPPAKSDTRKQTKRTRTQRVSASSNRVIAECDKVHAALDQVDAALIEIMRTAQNPDMPPLTIKELETGGEQAGAKRGWAVVSGDPQMPLTEKQAKQIVAAMQSLDPDAPIKIAAE